ncbi:hypothetical protein BSM4216_1211 [Bacillus smithii]|nr:hypothetical protein BSM4216_1211 [Bacillus smithii]
MANDNLTIRLRDNQRLDTLPNFVLRKKAAVKKSCIVKKPFE